jgi:hypothetical protein
MTIMALISDLYEATTTAAMTNITASPLSLASLYTKLQQTASLVNAAGVVDEAMFFSALIVATAAAQLEPAQQSSTIIGVRKTL